VNGHVRTPGEGDQPLNADLRSELLAMCAEDGAAVRAFLADAENHRPQFERTQAIRSGTPWPYALLEWEPREDAPVTARHVVDVVKSHTARLREIVSEYGWPGRSLVGENGADAAWLLLQHVNSQVTTIRSPAGDEFCRSCVMLLHEAVANGEAHPRHLAAIADSLRLGNDESPEFASLPAQYELDDQGRAVFRWKVDTAAIDQRRAAIGLPPLAADLARRRSGATANEIGPGIWEPWPPPRTEANCEARANEVVTLKEKRADVVAGRCGSHAPGPTIQA